MALVKSARQIMLIGSLLKDNVSLFESIRELQRTTSEASGQKLESEGCEFESRARV